MARLTVRGLCQVSILSMLVLGALPVSAQESPEPVAQDGTNDLETAVLDVTLPAGVDRNPALDLRSLSIVESTDEFRFVLGLRSISEPAEAYVADDCRYLVQFSHNGQPYQVTLWRALADQDYHWGVLQKLGGDEENVFIRFFGAEADTSAQTLSFDLLREDLLDGDGAAPIPGRVLDGFRVESHLRTSDGQMLNFGLVATGTQWDVADAMPDDGVSPTAFPVRIGLQQSGHAELFSRSPMRASNGEATTHVYALTLLNHGDKDDTFRLSATGVPAGWTLRIPNDLVRVPAGGRVDTPVLVAMPFAHTHGAVHKFRVEAQSLADPGSVGRAELGVRFHAVPQPAGHHPQVWFHTARYGADNPFFVVTDNLFSGNGGLTTFNALEEDENDQRVPVKGVYFGFGYPSSLGTPGSMWKWWLFLSPDLQMGLDFDLSRTGEVTVPLRANNPIPAAVVDGFLFHLAYDDAANEWKQTTLAVLEPTAPVDLVPSGDTVARFTINPLPAADLLPRTRLAYFGIELNLTAARPDLFTGAEAPELVPGGTMTLPLNEYHEPVDEAFAAAGLAGLRVEGPQQKSVNPGKTAVFQARLHNGGPDDTFALHVTGHGSEWARLPAGASVRLVKDDAQDVLVAVTVPADAAEGETADLILEASSATDPNLRSLVRFMATVTTRQDVPDESARVAGLEPKQKTPGLGVAAVAPILAAAAAVAMARRRE